MVSLSNQTLPVRCPQWCIIGQMVSTTWQLSSLYYFSMWPNTSWHVSSDFSGESWVVRGIYMSCTIILMSWANSFNIPCTCRSCNQMFKSSLETRNTWPQRYKMALKRSWSTQAVGSVKIVFFHHLTWYFLSHDLSGASWVWWWSTTCQLPPSCREQFFVCLLPKPSWWEEMVGNIRQFVQGDTLYSLMSVASIVGQSEGPCGTCSV